MKERATFGSFTEQCNSATAVEFFCHKSASFRRTSEPIRCAAEFLHLPFAPFGLPSKLSRLPTGIFRHPADLRRRHRNGCAMNLALAKIVAASRQNAGNLGKLKNVAFCRKPLRLF